MSTFDFGTPKTGQPAGAAPGVNPHAAFIGGQPMSINDLFAPGVRGNNAPQAITELKGAIDGAIKQLGSQTAFDFATVEIQSPNLKIGGVALYYSTAGGSVDVQVFVLESTKEAVPQRFVQSPQGSLEIPVTIDSYLDAGFISYVTEIVTAAVPAGTTVTVVDNIKVGHFDPKETGAINVAVNAAVSSAYSVARINAQMPTAAFTAAALSSAVNGTLSASYTLHPGATMLDICGNPMAADGTVALVATSAKPNGGGYTVHSGGGVTTMARANFLIDATRRNPLATGEGGYTPVIVATSLGVNGAGGNFGDTLLTILLSLAALAPLRTRYNQVFEPNLAGSRKTPLGILGLEYNPIPSPGVLWTPTIYETVPFGTASGAGNGFTVAELSGLFMAAPIFAIDVGMNTANSKLVDIIAEATPNSKQEAVVIAELNAFSGGLFGQLWHAVNGQNVPSIVQYDHGSGAYNTFIYSGYLPTNDGNVDIRHYDYFALCELTGGKMPTLGDLTKGFMPGMSSDIAMAEKYRALQSTFTNFKLTGITKRSYISPLFINVMEMMFDQLSLKFQLTGLGDFQSNNRPYFDTGTIAPMGQSSAFSPNVGNQRFGGAFTLPTRPSGF